MHTYTHGRTKRHFCIISLVFTAIYWWNVLWPFASRTAPKMSFNLFVISNTVFCKQIKMDTYSDKAVKSRELQTSCFQSMRLLPGGDSVVGVFLFTAANAVKNGAVSVISIVPLTRTRCPQQHFTLLAVFVSAVRFPHEMWYKHSDRAKLGHFPPLDPEESIMWSLALIGLLVGAAYGQMTLAVGVARLWKNSFLDDFKSSVELYSSWEASVITC